LTPRIFLPQPLAADAVFELPVAAARHVRVLRLQPDDTLRLFNGADDIEWPATIVRIGRNAVEVRLGAAQAVDRELPVAVTLAFGVPANDRMDALVEKAAELGARAIQPLVCERSVLRLAGERAEAKRRHWGAVAASASEQSGRARVTALLPMQPLAAWLDGQRGADAVRRIVLSFSASGVAPAEALDGVDAMTATATAARVVVLSGPEGGLTHDEEEAAVACGFVRVGLGPRVLRADTAPLAMLAWLGLATAPSRASP